MGILGTAKLTKFQCSSCSYRQSNNEGYCYMFEEYPVGGCYSHSEFYTVYRTSKLEILIATDCRFATKQGTLDMLPSYITFIKTDNQGHHFKIDFTELGVTELQYCKSIQYLQFIDFGFEAYWLNGFHIVCSELYSVKKLVAYLKRHKFKV